MLAAITLEPIKAGQEKLERVFSNDYAFSIPTYQRPYAWEVEHVQALLNDITEAMDEALAAPEEPITYFLGSIVLIKSSGAPEAQVVDGQQRLTTLTILLAVLRDLSDATKATSRHRFICEAGDPDTGAVDRLRVKLRPKDADFFRTQVQDREATKSLNTSKAVNDSQRCVARNTGFLRKELTDWPSARRDDLVAFLLQRCYLVVIAVENVDVAHRVFTVLNARGLDLTPTDILKAELLDRASLEEEDLARRWEGLEEAVGRDRFVDLFQHIRMMFQKEKPRRRLDVDFPKVVAPFQTSASFVKSVLEPIGDEYRKLLDRDSFKKRYGQDAANRLAHLRRLDNNDWVPPALRFLWREEVVSNQIAELFMRKLETLAYFLFLSRADINERIARYVSVIKDLEEPNTSDPVNGVPLWSLRSIALSADEQTRALQLLDGDIYERTRVRLPLLLRLDSEVSGKGATYETDIVSIEHVLPQSPASGSEWLTAFTEEERRFWLHKLANLVLLDRRVNVAARNWDFATKKAKYFTNKEGASPFALTTGVIGATTWNPTLLQKRQKELKRALATAWNLPTSSLA